MTSELTLFGVGATIGTGIFVFLSDAVPEAGPAVILAFVMAGVVAVPRGVAAELADGGVGEARRTSSARRTAGSVRTS